jgi:hypothetical protein
MGSPPVPGQALADRDLHAPCDRVFARHVGLGLLRLVELDAGFGNTRSQKGVAHGEGALLGQLLVGRQRAGGRVVARYTPWWQVRSSPWQHRRPGPRRLTGKVCVSGSM